MDFSSGHAPQKSGGLYVHVAFCRRKCLYCDFYSAGNRIADWHRYVGALCLEFTNRIDELAWPLRTVYFGGGTPSLMPEEEFLRLCAFLKPYMSDVVEFTMEVNPDDVDAHKLEVWKRGGVDRLSIGIQTFDDASLRAIGRCHDGACALEAYRLARKVFDNISIDLMFGLPGQTDATWMKDLHTALRLRPEHISGYSLMYEEGTALTSLRDKGRLEEAPEEMSERMFQLLVDSLSKAGYDHYEISNFALPGYRSRHNSSYWLQNPYIGLGPSAHSHDGEKLRKANRADLKAYLNYWTPDDADEKRSNVIPVESECLSEEELLEEYILTRLRTREGIPLDDFKGRFGDGCFLRLIEKSSRLVEDGLILLDSTHLSLSENAVMLSDSVILQVASLF